MVMYLFTKCAVSQGGYIYGPAFDGGFEIIPALTDWFRITLVARGSDLSPTRIAAHNTAGSYKL